MTANDNGVGPAKPYLELRHSGDGRALARTLARVIVRQLLIFANSNGDGARCGDQRAAG